MCPRPLRRPGRRDGRHAPGAIATLRDGDALDGIYACTRKDRLTARTGTPYLALELRDRSGALPARLFRDADLHGARFERGDLVRVRGRVASFRGELQAELSAIASAPASEVDPAAFLPATYRDVAELEGFLEHLAGEVRQPGYRALLASVLGDEQLRAALQPLAGDARRAPRLPRRAARAHRRGRHARGRDLRPAPAARPGPPALRGAGARPRANA